MNSISNLSGSWTSTLSKVAAGVFGTYLAITLVLAWWWDYEPDTFAVVENAAARAESSGTCPSRRTVRPLTITSMFGNPAPARASRTSAASTGASVVEVAATTVVEVVALVVLVVLLRSVGPDSSSDSKPNRNAGGPEKAADSANTPITRSRYAPGGFARNGPLRARA